MLFRSARTVRVATGRRRRLSGKDDAGGETSQFARRLEIARARTWERVLGHNLVDERRERIRHGERGRSPAVAAETLAVLGGGDHNLLLLASVQRKVQH